MRIVLRKQAGFATVFEPAEPVTDVRTQVKPYLVPMYRELERLGGISLGAQQVGVARRFFIWRDIRAGTRFFTTVINPRISFSTSERVDLSEADLCDPGRVIKISRPIGIRVCYTDLLENDHEDVFLTGIHAQVFLHEIERQNGVSLFRKAPEPAPIPEPAKEAKSV